jgi:hypothetical protein
MGQDRFYGYADPSIISAVRNAVADNQFPEEENCAEFHPGSTCSWKQTTFAVANVQLTFHENDKLIIDGMECVRIEPDIDRYKDLLAHGVKEVFPNLLAHNKTKPLVVLIIPNGRQLH